MHSSHSHGQAYVSLLLVFALIFSPCTPVFAQDRGIRPTRVNVTAQNGSTLGELEIEGKYYALVIGINNYQSIPQLETAVKDAEAVAKTLETYYGFEVISLLDKDATRDGITKAINDVRRRLKYEDKLLIYYAGHGYYDEEVEEAYWLPVDAEESDDSNWILSGRLTTNLKRIAAAQVMVVSDSCYSGTLSRAFDPNLQQEHLRMDYLQKMMEKPSRVLLASGGNEPVADGGGSGHSVFARAFMNALQEMDREVFTAEELFIQGRLKESVAGKAEQTPEYKVIRNSGHDGGDFVFHRTGLPRKPSVSTVTTSLPSEPSSSSFSLDDLEAVADQREALRSAWGNKQTEMDSAFSQVESYEQRNIAASLKIKAWQRFISAFSEDNPYSSEDETKREHAQSRINFWQSEETRIADQEREAERLRQEELARKQREAEAERLRQEELARKQREEDERRQEELARKQREAEAKRLRQEELAKQQQEQQEAERLRQEELAKQQNAKEELTTSTALVDAPGLHEAATHEVPEPPSNEGDSTYFRWDSEIVVQKQTNLMWSRVVSTHDWNSAPETCKGLQSGGHSTWRLPTKLELERLSLALNREGIIEGLFSQTGRFWTSTPYPGYTTGIWGVHLQSGMSSGLSLNEENTVVCVADMPNEIAAAFQKRGLVDKGEIDPFNPILPAEYRTIVEGSRETVGCGFLSFSCEDPLAFPEYSNQFYLKNYRRFKVYGSDKSWTETELSVEKGDQLVIFATGKVTTCNNCERRGPQPISNQDVNIRFKNEGLGRSVWFRPNRGGYSAQVEIRPWEQGTNVAFAVMDGNHDGNTGSYLLDVFVIEKGREQAFDEFLTALYLLNEEDVNAKAYNQRE